MYLVKCNINEKRISDQIIIYFSPPYMYITIKADKEYRYKDNMFILSLLIVCVICGYTEYTVCDRGVASHHCIVTLCILSAKRHVTAN